MTPPQTLVIKTSPVVFLKRLVIIEVIWAVLASAFSFQGNLPEIYSDYGLTRFGSYAFLLGLLVTVIQIAIIAGAFMTWYLDTYRVDRKSITHWQAMGFGNRELAPLQAITELRVRQSALGDRFNYGTLELHLFGADRTALMKNIPNPHQTAEQIRTLLRPRPTDHTRQLEQPIPALIAAGEGQTVEFKSSFSWDYRRQRINRDLNKAVMKNVAGFMNTTGGAILLGVDDDGQILGLETEIQTLGKPNVDGFENSLNIAFNNMIGAEYRQFARFDFAQIEGKTVCRIVVLPSPEPVFLRLKNLEEFYIRTGNSSQPLSLSQAVKYIQTHFEN
ncbi:MAG: ATP-binding protein [Chloroflexi bacterium]|nr:MAG: ATP-binding protein [Chloroflexota bacterium]